VVGEREFAAGDRVRIVRITSAQATAFDAFRASYANAMSAWLTAETRTPIACAAKRTARAELLEYAKFIVE
jgi:hypothetical protein